MNTTAMERTEQLTQNYRQRYDVLADRVQDLEGEVEKLKRRRLPGIKSAVHAAAQARDELQAHIEQHPELFDRPRTVVIAGIRVGLMKGKGKIEFDAAEKVVRLIRKHLPDQADSLIRVTEAPVKKALGNLSTAELKRIGCTVEETADQVVIKPVDGDVDKLVNALLKEAEHLEEVA